MTLTLISTVIFAAIGLALHARRLPPQNLIAIALLIFVSAAAVEWGAQAWSFPFSPLPQKDICFGCLPIVWIGALLFFRKVAQILLNSHRGSANYGLWILALTVLMTVAFWSLLETFLMEFKPLNVIGRAGVSVAMLLVIFPWLIEKRPKPLSPEARL